MDITCEQCEDGPWKPGYDTCPRCGSGWVPGTTLTLSEKELQALRLSIEVLSKSAEDLRMKKSMVKTLNFLRQRLAK